MKRTRGIFLTAPTQNEFPDSKIEKLQLQLQLQLQAEQMKYRDAIEHDKVFEEVKPIRLKIKLLQEKIKDVKLRATVFKLHKTM